MRKQIKFALLNLLLSIAGLMSPEIAHAQFLGNVSLTTVSQVLANGTTCTGNAQLFVVVNLGQTQHLATASSAAASFVMEIDGIDALTNSYKISNPLIGVAPNKFLVQANGYMPITQVSVTCTVAATFSLTYSGSFSANPIASVGAPGSSSAPSASFAGNVQGVLSTGTGGGAVFPIVNGALAPTVNGSFFTLGLDNFSSAIGSFAAGQTGTFGIGSPPPPSKTTDWALVFYTGFAGLSGTGLQAPWVCIPAAVGSCGATAAGGAPVVAQLSNVATTNIPQVNLVNSSAFAQTYVHFLEFTNAPTSIRQATSVGSQAATALGSTLVISIFCQNSPCVINSVTDSQGNTWKKIVGTNGTSGQMGGMEEWITGPTSAAGETITITPNGGTTVSISAFLELVGLTPANLNQPIAPLGISNHTLAPNENDNGGLFVESGGYSFSQTLTIATAGTTTVSLWQQSQHGVFSSCVLSQRVTNIAGAGTTLNTYLQDSADGVGFNDRLSMAQSTTAGGANNQLGAVAGGTGITPATTGDAALAAGSKLDGPLGAFGRIKFVVVGASAAVTVTYNVVCR